MPKKFRADLKTMLGCFCIFLSAFAFYLATVAVKRAQINGLKADPAFFAFARFLFGFVVVTVLMKLERRKIRVVNLHYLIGRTLANCVAVYCFFRAVDLTSVAQGNILNMTYPLFIAVFSWIFLKGQRDIIAVIIVSFAFAGVWLILAPGGMHFHWDSLWGLASGISAAIAIIYLNLSRQVHDTETTLFFLFGLGSIVIYAVFFDKIHIPDRNELEYLFYCSFASIAGQYLITLGFKYVTAIEGSIISSTRILLAALLGPVIAMEPALTFSGWTGAFLIFSANVYLALRKAKARPHVSVNPL